MKFSRGYGRSRQTLFSEGDLHAFLDQRTRNAISETESYDAKALAGTDTEKLVEYFAEKHGLVLPRLLDADDQITGDQQETETEASLDSHHRFFDRDGESVKVPAILFTFTVAFEGDADLFRYQPNTFGPMKPEAEVGDDALTFHYTLQNPDPGSVTARLKKDVEQTKSWLRDINTQVTTFNNELKAKLRDKVNARKQRLNVAQQTMKGLPFKMKVRDDTPKTYAAPEIKKKVALKPPVPSPGADPEPVMLDETYEHILATCGNMARVLELSPKAFVKMEEETLRSHFLVQLNGHYQGEATGETFNYEGKTDILVKSKGRNIFIAECKFWDGDKVFTATIDQILGYLSWRDTKAAILLFNRNKDFTSVLKKVQELAKQHPNFKTEVSSYKKETEFRFIFKHKDDAERELTLTVSAFNVPT